MDTISAKSPQKRRPGRPRGGINSFPGLGADAKLLGVSSFHLRSCLTGKRRSETLVARYIRLKGSQFSELCERYGVELGDQIRPPCLKPEQPSFNSLTA